VSARVAGTGIDEARRTPPGRWFFAVFAIAIATTILIGFSQTYYFKELTAAPELPFLFHLHGALFTAWAMLFIVQASLIPGRRTAVHRQLGILGVLLIPAMLVTGLMVAVLAARGEGPLSSAVASGSFDFDLPEIPPLVGMVVPFASVTIFTIFAGLGLAYRRRPPAHKRFMALAAVAILPPALGRAIGMLAGPVLPLLFFAPTILFIAAIGIHDWRTLRRVHPVTLWGGLALLASFPLRLALGNSDPWLAFAEWLTR
jgi:hypothetical protein